MEYFLTNDYYLLSLVTYAIFFIFNLLVCLTGLKQKELSPKYILLIDLAFLIIASLFVIIERLYTVKCEITNLDESFDLALTLNFSKGYHFWTGFNPTSVGPINTLLFYLVSLVIGEVSYLTAKVSALLVILVSLYFVYFAAIKICKRSIATPVASCYAFYMVIPWSAPIVSYNTEYSLLLTLSIYFWCFVRFDTSKFAQILSFGVLALMPFCKLQGAPLSLFLYIYGLYRIVKLNGFSLQLLKILVGVVLISSIPLICVILDCLRHDSFLWFYRSYFLNMVSYVDVSTSLETYIHNFINLVSDNIYVIIFSSTSILLSLILLKSKNWRIGIFSLAVIVISVYEMLKPNFAFLHYTNILIIPIIFLTLLQIKYLQIKLLKVAVTICALVFQFIQVSYFDEYANHKNFILTNSLSENFWKSIAYDIKSMSNADDKLIIWGWLDLVHVYSQLPTGSSELGIGAFVPQDFINRTYPPYIKDKFKQDLINNKPRFFLDSPSPITQIYSSYKYSVQNYEEFAEIINKNYHIAKQYFYPADNIPECNFVKSGADNRKFRGCVINLYEINK